MNYGLLYAKNDESNDKSDILMLIGLHGDVNDSKSLPVYGEWSTNQLEK